MFVVFCLLEKKKKKSFHYLVFDSDDSLLFYSLAPDFYKLFLSVLWGGAGSEIFSLPQAPRLPSRSYPQPASCQTLTLHIPTCLTSHHGQLYRLPANPPKSSGLGRGRRGGTVSLIFQDNFFPEFGFFGLALIF